ncbi:MAG: ABC transporter substrate-binding protein, partial [Comamonadaceae bacterium]
RRLGVVVTPASNAVLRQLQRATDADARGWSLQVESASDPTALGAALRAVLARSDALIVLPDAIGDSQAATLAVLRAAAAVNVPVFGSNEGMVRSGALAASVSTPTQLALQAQSLGERLAARTAVAAPAVEWAASVQVRINPHVARSLDLRLPGEEELAQRLFGTGRGS